MGKRMTDPKTISKIRIIKKILSRHKESGSLSQAYEGSPNVSIEFHISLILFISSIQIIITILLFVLLIVYINQNIINKCQVYIGLILNKSLFYYSSKILFWQGSRCCILLPKELLFLAEASIIFFDFSIGIKYLIREDPFQA